MKSPAFTQIKPAELLTVNPGTLKSVHNHFMIDWEKPVAVVRMTTPSTRSAIRKAAAALGYDAAPALILVHAPTRWERRYIMFTLDSAGTLDNPKDDYKLNAGGALDDSWSKGRFDELRKDEKNTVYAVFQNQEDNSQAPEIGKPNDYTRYTITEEGFYNHGPKSYRLRPLDRSRNNANAPINYYWKDGKQAHDQPADILDRSGYYIRDRRENLKRRAAALKAEREKAAYMIQNTAADVETVTAAANALRKDVAALLTCEDLARSAVAASAVNINGWYFADALKDAALFQSRSAAHEYKSAAHAEKAKRNTLGRIDAARQKIFDYIAEKEAGKEEKTA